MVEPLDDATIDALQEQGGITDEGTEDIKPDESQDSQDTDTQDLPDIDLGGDDDKTDDKSDADDTEDSLDTKVTRKLEDAGYTEEALIERLKKDDGISDEFVEELKQKIDPEFVDAHVARLRAEYELEKIKQTREYQDQLDKNKAVQEMNEYIFKKVGSADNFKTMGDVLKQNIDQSELDAINAKLQSGNKTVVDEALKIAVDKYNYIKGKGGKLMSGDAGGGKEEVMHITKEEYRQIMRSEKYKTDPLYARKIDSARLSTRESDEKKYGKGHYFGFHPSKGKYAL